ncbi:hypothetical protein SNEBB_002621 [Seison nebaliae]|nr:hypothetical protein SNEBB_002621 [Seison nebaliae]
MVEGIVNSNDFTKVSSTTQPIFIIFIKSGVERFDHRKSIRNSWLSKKSIKFLKNYEIFHRFVIGQSKNQTIIKKVFEENKNHSDIVIGDFEDNYYNNTAKATLAFRLFCDVVKRRFGNSLITNLIIIDDDYWLNLKNLERFLIENKQNSLPQKLLLFSGYTFDDSLPRRSILDKWTIDTSKYPFCSYPIYVSAGIMILSRDIALRINLIERFVTFRKFDDIFFGIIASLLKIDLTTTNNEYFITFNYRSSTKLTRDKAISIHGIEEKALERKWKRYCQLHCRK